MFKVVTDMNRNPAGATNPVVEACFLLHHLVLNSRRELSSARPLKDNLNPNFGIPRSKFPLFPVLWMAKSVVLDDV
jgi:hypothetical protein